MAFILSPCTLTVCFWPFFKWTCVSQQLHWSCLVQNCVGVPFLVPRNHSLNLVLCSYTETFPTKIRVIPFYAEFLVTNISRFYAFTHAIDGSRDITQCLKRTPPYNFLSNSVKLNQFEEFLLHRKSHFDRVIMVEIVLYHSLRFYSIC